MKYMCEKAGTWHFSLFGFGDLRSGEKNSTVISNFQIAQDSQACHWAPLSSDALIFGCTVYTGYVVHWYTKHEKRVIDTRETRERNRSRGDLINLRPKVACKCVLKLPEVSSKELRLSMMHDA